jgi:hypothetical protein
MYEGIKKSIKFICNDCGEFFPTNMEYCDICGSSNIRKAKSKDLSKYMKTHDIERFEELKSVNEAAGICHWWLIIIILVILVIAAIGYFLITWDI